MPGGTVTIVLLIRRNLSPSELPIAKNHQEQLFGRVAGPSLIHSSLFLKKSGNFILVQTHRAASA